MPSKCSHAAPERGMDAMVNSARYHQGRLYGLSAGIGRFANWPPTGYDVRGDDPRFMPKYGSGSSLLATSAATTVVGTVAACHAFASKPGCEIASPVAVTFADDSMRHPVEICSGVDAAAGCDTTQSSPAVMRP